MRSLRSGTVAVLLLLSLIAGGCTWPFGIGVVVPLPPSNPVEDFTIIALPDTQNYAQTYPEIFNAQTDWIVANAERLNIVAVLHEGDVVNRGARAVNQWIRAEFALSKIDRAGIPMFIAIGNHDYDDEAATRTSTMFNMYFGLDRYAGKTWFGGSYDPKESQNVYGYIHAGGQQLLILVLEFGPRARVVQWANEVVADHPDHQVILLTHNHLTATGVKSKRLAGNRTYGVEFDPRTDERLAYTGEMVWNDLISQHPNFLLVLSGHVTGEASRRSDNAFGRPVHQLMANYQFRDLGGEGYLRIMTFKPEKGVIEVQTYSPYSDAYFTDAGNKFTLPWVSAVGAAALPLAQ